MYILSATLSEDARKKALDKILDGITEKGGSIRKVLEIGRRKLAYTIEKRREGYYYLIYFNIIPSAISHLWEEYQLHEDLLKYMTSCCSEADILESFEFKPLKQS